MSESNTTQNNNAIGSLPSVSPANDVSGTQPANAVANTSQDTQSHVDNRENEFLQKFGMLSRREQSLRAREMEVEKRAKQADDSEAMRKLAAENPMAFLEKFGLSYGRLTEIALGGGTSQQNTEVDELKKRISDFENEYKSDLQKRRDNEEKAALVTVMSDIRKAVADSEDFELVRAYEAFDDVWELMVMYYESHKKWLPIDQAAREVENQYRSKAQKLANTNYISTLTKSQGGAATGNSQPPQNSSSTSGTPNSNDSDTNSALDRSVALARERLRASEGVSLIRSTLSNAMTPQASQAAGNSPSGKLSEDDLRQRALAAFKMNKG